LSAVILSSVHDSLNENVLIDICMNVSATGMNVSATGMNVSAFEHI